MLTVVTYCWGEKYNRSYVAKIAAGVKRNLSLPHRFAIVTDDRSLASIAPVWMIPDEDRYLLKLPGCLARLRMFDPKWQAKHGINEGDRLVCIDLDAIVTGPLDPLFDRSDDFTILQGINTTNPNPMNGSIFMLRGGANAHVWSDFSFDAISKLWFHAFPDDQGWFDHKIKDAGAWGPADGVYGFKKVHWPKGDDLPANARLVAFPGWRDPSKFEHLAWIREHWRA
jgi:hypothetical protein